MFFTDISFFIFLPIVVAIYWCLPHRGQNWLLLVASYIFYAWAVPWTALLMLGVTLLHFFAAQWIESLHDLGGSDSSAQAKKTLILTTILSISILSWFKYTTFVIENLKVLFPALPIHLSILLPAGVSFFTFHALAYTIDVYRKDFKAEKDFVSFAVFMAFFPQLVAGPISRAANLLTQVVDRRRWQTSQFWSGIDKLLIGYVKKIVIADNVATYVNMIFDLKRPSWMMLFIGGIGFSIQILADFSSYTDIARGCAKLLGFELIENFDRPYLSQSPSEFWRRWHMSLSNCIRDYLYIPLGGSKVSTGRWLVNVLITWLLCGLWHGAGWNFIVWGLYWGVLLILYRFITLVPEATFSWMIRLPVMYFWIVCGWILFRTKEMSLFLTYVTQPFFGHDSLYIFTSIAALYIMIFFSIPLLVTRLALTIEGKTQIFSRYQLSSRIVGYGIGGLLLLVFAAERSEDFYYFQF